MGSSCSKLDDDASLILCRDRKHFIRQAIDCRSALAATHVAYIHSLRNTGTALRNFVQPELHSESSLYTTSNSATPEPLSSTENSLLSNSSPSVSRHVETSNIYSPTTSCVDSMLSSNINSRKVEEKPSISQRVEQSEAACTPPPWDYFDSFSPIDRKESLLEDEGEKSFLDERDSDDEFDDMNDKFEDDSSSEVLVKMYRNINDTSYVTPTMATSSVVTLSVDGKYGEFGSEAKVQTKDFFSCVKEIEDLFLKAYESGGEIPRMLEANRVQFRPLFRETTAHKSKISTYLNAWFTFCTEESIHSQAPIENELKHLTWHRSSSSLSSSTRYPLGPTSKNEADNIGSNLFGSMCMNSGSHASTLERLYAWERKLYDEIKASSIIQSEYDMKCKLLRDQDLRDEHAYRIERARASVKDLHYRIKIAIHRLDSISKGIEEIRDKELQPQLEELIESMSKMWRTMLDYHTNQYNIITSTTYVGSAKLSSMRSESHKQAAILLQAELSSLCVNFSKWISFHKSYLESINAWLLKCIFLTPPTRQRFSRKKPPPFSPRRCIAPPIFVTCRDWLKQIEELPTKEVEEAIKDLIHITTQFMPRLEKGHGAKRGGMSYEELHATESTVDWIIQYDTLQSGLVVFLDRLRLFAEKSVIMYEELQIAIAEARVAYDHGDDEFVAR